MIDDISYTNKDFGAVYTELLDLTKQLTNKWDPSLSNESDPGVVLLKHAAFVADKNNYNLDRNVLENFLTTASQEQSIRNIVEMNGYIPEYYSSAVGDISISINSTNDDLKSVVPFVIPAFTLAATNEDGDVIYTQAENLTIEELNKQATCKFIEGNLQEFTVNGSNIITMDNLDDNYRLYFSTKYVASNGIYIYDINGNLQDWTRSSYIFTEPLGNLVYSIDYDASKGFPYIQFPEDISSLIGSGLVIKYIQSSGINGNVGAGEINKLTSSLSVDGISVTTDEISVINLSSIVNGKDPETLSEMYESFKKTVGTFETLVTCKDYSNAIYLLENNGENLISNVEVTDRRNDYNKSLSVACYDSFGPYFETLGLSSSGNKFTFIPANSEATNKYDIRYNTKTKKYEYWSGSSWIEVTSLSLSLFNQITEQMSPYDLHIYALRALVTSEYNYYKYYLALENTFKPASDLTISEIKTNLEELKCINHIYKDLSDDDVFCFKNYVPINVMITTYNKITKVEKVEILNNVYKALTNYFNARNVEFGEELNYDYVENVILNADSRIKKISMSEFKYNPKYMLASGEEGDLYNSEMFVDLVAKNVLAGRLCLFDFESNFEHSYGQIDTHEISNIVSLSTETQIDLNPSYKLKDNEVISIVNPKYITAASYGSYVKYSANLANDVLAGSTYTLGVDEVITTTWTNNGITNSETYTNGTVICPSINLASGESEGTLASGQKIEIKVLSYVNFAETMLSCYWITNNSGNILFETDANGNGFKILDSNEYFVVTDSNYSTLAIYGAGTILTLNSTFVNKQISSDKITSNELFSSGLNAQFNWYKLNLFNGELSIQESNIINLMSGDEISVDADEQITLDNNWQDISSKIRTITYKTQDSDAASETINRNNWYARSRLDLSLNNSEPQQLSNTGASSSTQTVTIIYENELGERQTSVITGATEQGTVCLLSSTPLDLIGGENIDLELYSQLGYDVKLLYYNKIDNPFSDSRVLQFTKSVDGAEDTTKYYKKPDGNYTTENVGGDIYYKHVSTISSNVISVGDVENGERYDSSIYRVLFGYENIVANTPTNNKDYILPIYLNYSGESNIKAYFKIIGDVVNDKGEKVKNVSVKIKHYGSSESSASLMLKTNTNNLLVPDISIKSSSGEVEAQDIILTLQLNLEVTAAAQDVETISLNNIQIVNDINSSVKGLTNLPEVINKINDLISRSENPDVNFYWINKPNKSFEIDETDWSNPTFLFDKNNIANHITISQLDLRNSTIDFVKAVQDYD